MATDEKIDAHGGVLGYWPAAASERSAIKAWLTERWHLLLFTIGLIFTLAGFIADVLDLVPTYDSDLLILVAVAAGGTPVLVEGLGALLDKDLNVEFLATIAIIAAVVVSEYLAAALVVLMLTGGEILEDFTAGRTSRAIQLLIASAPQMARVRQDGKEVMVPAEEVKVGDHVLVKPGERIPVDGTVIGGSASVNQASLTGESIAVEKSASCAVLSGTIVELGALEIKAEKVGRDTTFAQVIKLVEEGQANRAPIEKIADRYARWFAPLLLSIAAVSFALTGNVIAAVSTLVIACPCALTLATPTAVVASIGNAAKKGILVRGGAALESVGRTDTVVLDKTGTITVGSPTVVEVQSFDGRPEKDIVVLAAVAEKFSEHPLAKAVLEKADQLGVCSPDPQDFKVLPGQGIVASYNGREILAGNETLLADRRVPLPPAAADGLAEQKARGRTVFIVCENSSVVGLVSVADAPRPGAAESIQDLRSVGVNNVVMLTGDNSGPALAVARQAGITEVGAGLLPEGKVEYIKKLHGSGSRVLMVGDGINDAPALAAAHVGVAMGKTGTDVAIETADIVLISDDLGKVPRLIEIGKRTVRLIKQNIMIAMAINVIGVVLAVSGTIDPVLAATIHEGNAMFVVLNSARLLWMR